MKNPFCNKIPGIAYTRMHNAMHKFSVSLCVLLLVGNVAWAQVSLSAKVSVKKTNVTLKSVLDDLEKQTGYYFVYTHQDVDVQKKVSLNVQDTKLSDALNQLCQHTGMTYEISAKYITLKKDARPVVQQSADSGPKRRSVSGKVLDATGEPVIGASIVEKGTTVGTITDFDGNFSLNISDEKPLVVSFVGMKTQEIPVKGKTNLQIVMHDDAIAMNEVVVVGYGTQKKINLTGAISTVKSETLVQAHRPNLSSALSGNLPGIRSVQTSGRPGEDGSSTLDIRGFGDALVIVDGVESSYKAIDPNDIESINVLKDASAAVYGFKGANGVILVTTKKGMEGKTKINYGFNYSLQSITDYAKTMNAVEYMSLINEDKYNTGLSPVYSQEDILKVKNGTHETWANTYWDDMVLKNTAPMQTHNLNISGGSKNVKYFTSFGYLHQDGIVRTKDSYERMNVRSNLSFKIIENLTADLNLSARRENRDSPVALGSGGDFDDLFSIGIFKSMREALPIYAPYANGNHKYYGTVQGSSRNPLIGLDRDLVGTKVSHADQFSGQFQLKYDLSKWVKGLSVRGMVNYERNATLAKENPKTWSMYSYDAATDTYEEHIGKAQNEINRYHDANSWLTQQYALDYSNTFGKHAVSGLMVWEVKKYEREYFKAAGELDNSVIPELDAASASNRKISGNSEEKFWAGLVGRFNYAYDEKYLAEVSFRYDGSYKFAKDKRWNLFPAFSLGWRISEESFIKDNTDIFDNIKLRGSYGIIGDEVDASPANYLEGYTYPADKFVFGKDNIVVGAKDKGLINPNFTWYESHLSNIGIDVSMWRGKLGVEFDYFYRKRTGLKSTLSSTLPTSFGATLPEMNLNSDSHRGFELVVSHKNTIKDLRYEVKGNLSYTRKMNLYKEQAPYKNAYLNWRNNGADRWQNIGWGYKAIGQFSSYEEILNAPIQDGQGNISLMPGDVKLEDFNHDGVINDLDQQPVNRDGTPEIFFGMNLSVQWKGVDFSMMLQGATHYTYAIQYREPFLQKGLGNGYQMFTDRWHREDPTDLNSKWIAGRFPTTRINSVPDSNGYASTYWNPNVWYLRLKNIELGYTLPKNLTLKAGIQSFRVYVGGYNLLTFAPSSVDGMDPEGSALYGMYYPQMKTVNLGFNVEF